MPSNSPPDNKTGAIGSRVVSGAGAFTAMNVFSKTLSVGVRYIVLANLLGPDDFGAFGAAALVIAFNEQLSASGFNKALIQRPHDFAALLPTALTVQVARGILIGLVLVLTAPFFGSIFEDPERVTELLRPMALLPVISAFNNIGTIALYRDLRFNRLIAITFAQTCTNVIVSFVWAFTWPSPWALVAGQLAATIVAVGMSYIMAPVRFQLGWNRQHFRELWSFGVWIFLSTTLSFTLIKGGDFAVGALLPLATLGIYQFADNLATRPTLELARVLNTVMFPAYSKIQTHADRLRAGFLRSYRVLCPMIYGIASLIIVAADDAIAIAVDESWQPAAIHMKLLGIWGASRALGAISSSLFQACGRPALATIFQGVMVAFFFAFIYPVAITYGSVGVAAFLATLGVVTQFARLPLLASVLEMPSWTLIRVNLLSLAATTASVSAASGVSLVLVDAPAIFRLGCCLVVNLLVLAGIVVACDSSSKVELVRALSHVRRRAAQRSNP